MSVPMPPSRTQPFCLPRGRAALTSSALPALNAMPCPKCGSAACTAPQEGAVGQSSAEGPKCREGGLQLCLLLPTGNLSAEGNLKPPVRHVCHVFSGSLPLHLNR